MCSDVNVCLEAEAKAKAKAVGDWWRSSRSEAMSMPEGAWGWRPPLEVPTQLANLPKDPAYPRSRVIGSDHP